MKINIKKLIFFTPHLEGAKTTSNNLDAVELVLTNEFQSKNLFIFTKKDATYFMARNKHKQ